MAWCQVGSSPSAGKKNYTWGRGAILKIESPHPEPPKMGNSQILGLVERTPDILYI